MILDNRKYKILIVEDNPGDLFLITDCLHETMSSPIVMHVTTFKEAINLLCDSGQKFDVILLDLSLPDKSGEDLISEMIVHCTNSPVIALTGYSDFKFSIHSLSIGIADYLLKDEITANSLYKSIVYSIERKKVSAELIESEKRYSNLFHLSPQPMWVYDLETLKYIQANQFAIDQYGYNLEEFQQMTLFDLRVENEDQEFIKTNEILVNGTQGPYKGRVKLLTKSRQQKEVDIYTNILTINHKEYGLIIGVDVTEKVLFENKITKAIIQAQEDERNEIGRELHDNVCQLLATCQLGLGMLQEGLTESEQIWFDQTKDLLQLSFKEIRNLSHRLAPSFFEEVALKENLTILLNRFNIENKYNINLMVDENIDKINFSGELHLNLFRILQEQLRNIQKYAQATEINIVLKISGKNLQMIIQDNGVGFDVNAVRMGIGLANIKRRVELFSGNMEIKSSPGNGCEIFIKIPENQLAGNSNNSILF